MYMAMIGMAIIAVPRGVFRAVTWLVMTVVGWLVASVEYLCADSTYSIVGGSTLVVQSDGNTYVSASGGGTGNILVDGNVVSGLDPNQVTSISITGTSGTDYITVKDVTVAQGFTQMGGYKCTIDAKASSDTIEGRDDTNGHDDIFGGDGSDVLYGHNGFDLLVGGSGGDTLYDGPGGFDDDLDVLYHGELGDLTDSDGSQDFIQEHANDDDTVYRNTATDNDQLNSL
jgi:hypothetical protein